SSSPSHVCSGKDASVAFSYLVTNSGDTFNASGTLVDDNGTPGSAGDDFDASWGPLTPGANQTLTQTRTLNITSPLINTARATGTTGPGGTASVSAQDTTIVIPHRCEIAVLKAAQPNQVCSGKDAQVTYGYVVGNTGDFFSASGNLVDDNGTPGNAGDDFSFGWGPLAPGQTKTVTVPRTVNITGALINTARATGTTGPGGTATVSAQDTTIVIPHRCTIDVLKSVTPSNVCAGKSADVTYSYTVKNSGDFFAASGTLADDAGTPGNPGDDFTLGSWGPLAPGGSQSFTRARTVNITS